MRCYLAAPLFTAAERQFNAALGDALRRALPDLELALPQEFCADLEGPSGVDHGTIFARCRSELERADLLLAVLDGADPDSGTSWECGFAVARGLPVLGLRTDLRPGEDGGANCMLTRSCVALLRDPAAVPAWLGRWLQEASQAKHPSSPESVR